MDKTLTLVLLRHGESVWNLENIFTGWTDVPLSDRGRDEATTAGLMMNDEPIGFEIVHTSLLARAIMTADLALDVMGLGWVPVARHWRLNERHYGALQGLNKKATADKYGIDQVKIWRRSFSIPPPGVEITDERHPSHDIRYDALAPELLPATECLADVVDRMMPYWHDAIVPDLKSGKRVLVVAHGNSLRALVKHLDGISDEEISDLNIPTGVPLLYELDSKLKVLSKKYLGDPAAIEAATTRVAKQAG